MEKYQQSDTAVPQPDCRPAKNELDQKKKKYFTYLGRVAPEKNLKACTDQFFSNLCIQPQRGTAESSLLAKAA